jgi:hypothetical protein
MSILKPNQIKFGDIFNNVKEYLTKVYNQTGDVFSPSSAYGQILNVMQNFMQMVFLYIEDSIVEQNITTASKLKSVQAFSRLAGHDPTRSISAQGTVKLKWKPTVVDLNASYVNILDKTKLKCENNSLQYFLLISNSLGSIKLNKNDNSFTYVKIIQGEIESQTRTGDGNPLQSFNFQSNKPIDNDNVSVKVNGNSFEIVDSLYDMKKGDYSCMVKTGLAGGIDLYFGNEDFGVMPPVGSVIEIEYIKTDGYGGNIFGKSNSINFKFIENSYANTGEEVDLNEFLEVSVDKSIILGADAESMELTKMIAPYASRSFVLANPNNYVNLLSRFNYSFVDAYTTYEDEYIDDDNVVYLFLIPDISKRLQNTTDYFTTNIKNFYLDEDEKSAVYKYINQSGRQIVSSELEIVDPIVKKYVMNIFLRIFDFADISTLNNEIVNAITNYLIKVRRRDKIPKSDLVSIIENIHGVDSVNISFVCKENEDSIINGYYIQKVSSFDNIRGIMSTKENKITISPNTDPNLGLDEFGDIKIGLNEMPIFRGGWSDRFGNYYESGVSHSQYSSINIIVKEVIKETIATKQMTHGKNSLNNV